MASINQIILEALWSFILMLCTSYCRSQSMKCAINRSRDAVINGPISDDVDESYDIVRSLPHLDNSVGNKKERNVSQTNELFIDFL